MFDVNSLSLSEVILSGVPWFVNIYLSNRLAIRRVSMVSVVGIMYAYLVSRSTTTIIISLPSEIGSFVMKSMVINSNGRFGRSVGWIGSTVGCVMFLVS